MKKYSRRKLLQLSLMSSVAGILGVGSRFAKALALMPTPSETEGPFYPVINQKDKDADLTHIEGYPDRAIGQYIVISGRVTDVFSKPVEKALLDIWQADANGRYRHPRDPNESELDQNFQGWATIRTDGEGLYRFKTVMPGAYPASKTWTRPPHIHLKVFKPGYEALTTQMYFPDQILNKSDLLLGQKSVAEQSAMIATEQARGGNLIFYEYNIVLDLLRN
ncbi:MAG: protocatechuate 3,4-dioxygenase [Proteobacteria bacterium SG_bin4]|nr:MAG: protocatechuate 3,4-dioxygenase [Proteobacteria bacterium SG_bin4]